MAPRFSMPAIVKQALPELLRSKVVPEPTILATILDPEPLARVVSAVLRSSFFIELVKAPKIETTKFEVRWAAALSGDPRYAEYETCIAIAAQLLRRLETLCADGEFIGALRLFTRFALLPYESPIDYGDRTRVPIHTVDNVIWIEGPLPGKLVRLRAFLLDPSHHPHNEAFRLIYDKIRVKSYLTDRALTGMYKTNREKRWETHPDSPQFAIRRDCLGIEHTLINQICHFEGFPLELSEALETEELLTPAERPFRCPITLEPLVFSELEEELLSPKPGRSGFQVGHLNPLKAVNDDPTSGHTPQNISWISENGNRMQGSLTLEQTRQLISRVSANYHEKGFF